MDPTTNDRLPDHLGRYRVVSRIAAGSFAVVYRGRDEDLGRDVAIKLLHPELLSSPKVLASFLKEARILAGLDHPAIVPIFDIGSTSEGQYYLVTKLVEGSDLKTRLKRGPLSHDEASEIVAGVAEALDYAHRQGLVHRDVKPGNILLAC